MRHLNSGSKLGKQPAHRRAVLRSLVTNLIEHGRITTTLTRAKAARPVAEKMITLGKRDTLQSRRQAASYIMLPAVTQKLFGEIAPKFADRAGGYTRIIHAGNRVGDKAKEGRNGGSKELSTPSQGNSQKPVPADRNGLFVCRSAGELAAAEWCVRQKEICLPLFPLHLRIAASGTKSKARRRRRMRRRSQAGNRKARPYGWRRVLGEPRPGRNIPWRRKMPRCPTSSATLCGRRARRDKAKDKK